MEQLCGRSTQETEEDLLPKLSELHCKELPVKPLGWEVCHNSRSSNACVFLCSGPEGGRFRERAGSAITLAALRHWEQLSGTRR